MLLFLSPLPSWLHLVSWLVSEMCDSLRRLLFLAPTVSAPLLPPAGCGPVCDEPAYPQQVSEAGCNRAILQLAHSWLMTSVACALLKTLCYSEPPPDPSTSH